MTTTAMEFGQETINVVLNETGQFVRLNADGTGLVGPNGPTFYGQLIPDIWMKIPSIFRLRITGTGTVSIDAKDTLGNITASVASYTVSGATDQIEFPYVGDDAVAIRATITGTCTVEVI